MEAAKATAARTQRNWSDDVISAAFRLILGRPPSSSERSLTSAFLQSCASRRKETQSSTLDPDPTITELCRALFNLNAFVYVD
jgi:hypothetical protein